MTTARNANTFLLMRVTTGAVLDRLRSRPQSVFVVPGTDPSVGSGVSAQATPLHRWSGYAGMRTGSLSIVAEAVRTVTANSRRSRSMNLRLGSDDDGSPFRAFVTKEVDFCAIVGAELFALPIEVGAAIFIVGELVIADDHAFGVNLDAEAPVTGWEA